MTEITSVKIRMYKTGTGDFLALRFYQGAKVQFKMMIDSGTWKGTKPKLNKHVNNLKDLFKNKVDLLVVTHEHKDHVHIFDACEDLFCDDKFEVDKIWMGWTEDDKSTKVKKWKKEFGAKKNALAEVSHRISKLTSSDQYESSFKEERNGQMMFEARRQYGEALDELAELHFSASGAATGGYKKGLDGMEVVKKKIKKNKIEYLTQGKVIGNIDKLPGVRFYILGPPDLIEDVKKEKGRKGSGETYDHNKELGKSEAFAAMFNGSGGYGDEVRPFKREFLQKESQENQYYDEGGEWRKIDHDWLFSAGMFALRMNSATNNLSLALAIEIESCGKVLLFPGDAEYGSWASWHEIPWKRKGPNGKHLTEHLLNQTIFYKVAHHLSQNGTPNERGMKMMTHPDLIAMATLDYDTISSKWKTTMPNRGLLKDLIQQTKGRLIVMNTKNLFYDFNDNEPLMDRILEERGKMKKGELDSFTKSHKEEELFHEVTIKF